MHMHMRMRITHIVYSLSSIVLFTESCLIFISRPAVVMAVSLSICRTARIAETYVVCSR